MFSLRIVVPDDIVETFGRDEVKKALGTADEPEARRRALQMRAEYEGMFTRHRMQVAAQKGQKRLYGDAQLEVLAKELYDREIHLDDLDRAHHRENPPSDPHLGPSLPGAWARAGYLDAMKRDLHDGKYHHVAWWVDAVIQRDALAIPPNSPDWRTLAYNAQKAMIEATRIKIDRDNGNFGTRPADPLITQPKKIVNPAHTFDALFTRYREHAPVKGDTLNQDQMVVRLFAEYVGPGVGPLDANEEHVRDFRDDMLRYPSRAALIKEFAGLGVREVIEANERVGKPTLSAKTVNRYMSGLSSFFGWLRTNAYVRTNPVSGMFLNKRVVAATSGKRRAFRHEELQAIIDSNWFHRERDAAWWLPLLALHTGARRGELAQLEIADLKTFDGRLCIVVTDISDEDEGNRKSVKNLNSRRIVPVHRALLDLGFAELVAARGNGRHLFDEIKPDSRGHWGTRIGEDFANHLRRLGLHTVSGSTKVATFHSFRHTFVTELRRSYPKGDVELLTGHARSMIDEYTHIADSMLARKIEMIDHLDYRLDLRRLRRPTS